MLAVLKSGLIRLVPVADKKHRAALIVQLKRHTPAKTSALTVLRTWHYVVMRALRTASAQQFGIVMVGDLGGASFNNLDLRIPKTILGAVSKNVPLRVHRICVIRPFMVLRVLLPVVKPFMSQKIRSRLVVLPDPASKEQGLAQHLEVGKLPEDVCGTEKEFNHLATVESWEKEDSKLPAECPLEKEREGEENDDDDDDDGNNHVGDDSKGQKDP
mmetsp:Transcript_15826/g.22210  ORF Transcript_15826/g.22210 Transcript_15826/m.22210 type:complete len:215 (-) Transcript_15826:221-865(-)